MSTITCQKSRTSISIVSFFFLFFFFSTPSDIMDLRHQSSAMCIIMWVGGNRSKERDRKSELVLRLTNQIFEWDRNNSDRNFYNVVRYVHIPLVP